MLKNSFFHKLKKVGEDMAHSSTDDVLTLTEIIMYRNKELDVAAIYKLLGADLFVQLLYLLKGKTVEFPTPDEFKKTFEWALCYYAKEIQNREWKDIRNDFEIQETSIKCAMRNKQLNDYMASTLHKKLSENEAANILEQLKQKVVL